MIIWCNFKASNDPISINDISSIICFKQLNTCHSLAIKLAKISHSNPMIQHLTNLGQKRRIVEGKLKIIR